MKAMILAAGRGERLRPLTDTLPKPLVEVADKPLIVYHIERLAEVGVTDIVINHAWLGHKLEQALGDGSRWQVKLHYSAEVEALETGGGIKQALPLLGDKPFLVINGDVFIEQLPRIQGRTLSDASALVALRHHQAYLWLVDNPTQHPDGDFALADGQLSIEGESKLTFSGIGLYHPSLFDDTPQGRFGLAPLLKQKMAVQSVAGEYFGHLWCDVGTPERLYALDAQVRAKQLRD